MATYSFMDFSASLIGPGIAATIGGPDSSNADEGVTVSYTEDKGTMTTGASGSGMHSLHAGKSGVITVRLLKTSPINALLSKAYNLQTASSALYGRNVLTLRDAARNDAVVGRQAAFRKHPDLSFAKVGNTVEWAFNVIKIDTLLGAGDTE